MSKNLGDRADILRETLAAARNSDNITIDQFCQILGCNFAMNWILSGETLSDIEAKCDCILRSGGEPSVYRTAKKVAAVTFKHEASNRKIDRSEA